MLPPNSHLRSRFHLLFVTVAILTMSVVTASPSVAQTPPQKLPLGCNEPISMDPKYPESIPRNSLTKYRLAESLFMQHQYQASANAFRFALHGDGDPSWTMVWSYIGLGKIFDVTDQRERALIEYQCAIKTNDNTRGALDEAQQLVLRSYELPDAN